MASTVAANSLEVATTTSDHIAHATEPDFRIAPGTAPSGVGLLNYIESEYLVRNLPALTEFNTGKIWVTPSECGAPPPTKPPDGFPGAKNGGLVNSYAIVAPGAGSGNVFVEGEKVQRFTDKTLQNAKNSKGMINDRAGFEEYKKNFKPVTPKDLGKDGPKGGDDESGEGDPNAPTEPEPASEPPPEPEPETPPGEDPCIIKSATVVDKDGRQTEGGPTKREGGLLEVVPPKPMGETISLTAVYEGECPEDQHPFWTVGGYWSTKIDGATGSFQARAFDVPMAITAIAPMMKLFDFLPRKYDISAVSHQSTFTRIVHSYPNTQSHISLAFEQFKKVISKFETLGKKFGLTEASGINALVGEVRFVAGWKETESHLATCQGKINGSFWPLLGMTLEKHISLIPLGQLFPALIPVVKFVQGVNWAFEKVFGDVLFDIYFVVRLAVNLNLTVAVSYSRVEGGKGEITLSGTGRLEIGLGARIYKGWAKAEFFVRVEVVVAGGADFSGKGVGLFIEGSIPPVKGIMNIKTMIDKWWFSDVQFRKEIALTNTIWKFLPRKTYPLLS